MGARVRWAASVIRADYPKAIIYVNALCATVTGNNDCNAHRNSTGHWSHWIGQSNISWISQDFCKNNIDAFFCLWYCSNIADYVSAAQMSAVTTLMRTELTTSVIFSRTYALINMPS